MDYQYTTYLYTLMHTAKLHSLSFRLHYHMPTFTQGSPLPHYAYLYDSYIKPLTTVLGFSQQPLGYSHSTLRSIYSTYTFTYTAFASWHQ